MDTSALLEVGLRAIAVAAQLAAPLLITSLVVGFTISLFQSMTQIQEVTLSFVPKAAAVAVALLICGNWMISSIVTFTHEIFALIPSLIGR